MDEPVKTASEEYEPTSPEKRSHLTSKLDQDEPVYSTYLFTGCYRLNEGNIWGENSKGNWMGIPIIRLKT